MRRSVRTLAMVGVVLALPGASRAGELDPVWNGDPAWARPAQPNPSADKPVGPPSVLYVLDEDAMYVEGCFGGGEFPCLCPLKLASSFEGTFGVTLLPAGNPLFDIFEISNVEFQVAFGDDSFEVTGGGLYFLGESPEGPVQRMVLELIVDGQRVETFDSELVPVPEDVEFPAIAIAVDRNDLECFDTQLTIRAAPGG